MKMSKLLDYIKVTATEQRKYVQKPLQMVDVRHDVQETYYPDIATMYRVEARLGSQIMVTDSMKATYGWEQVLAHKVYVPLANSVFGEFRQPLLDADLAIAQGEYDKASQLIREVLDTMFKV
jgi:hypothetical protein